MREEITAEILRRKIKEQLQHWLGNLRTLTVLEQRI